MAENADLVAAVGRQVGYDLTQVDGEDALAVVESVRSIAETLQCDPSQAKTVFGDLFRDRDSLNSFIDIAQMDEPEEAQERGVNPSVTAARIKRQWLREFRAERFLKITAFFDDLRQRYSDLPQVMPQLGNFEFDAIVDSVTYSDTSAKKLEDDVCYIADSTRITEEQRKLFICYRILSDYDYPTFYDVFNNQFIKDLTTAVEQDLDFDNNDVRTCNEILMKRINENFISFLEDDLLSKVLAMDKNGADIFMVTRAAMIYYEQTKLMAERHVDKVKADYNALTDPRLNDIFRHSAMDLPDED